MISVLMICTGNICRSPMAEGVLRHLVEQAGLSEQIKIDSAGMINWHQGDAPDLRAQTASLQRGIDISRQRARHIKSDDFDQFDYLIAMDKGHLQELDRLRHNSGKVYLLAEFAANNAATEVIDPYYGNAIEFEQCLELIIESCQELLKHIRRQHEL